MELNFLVCLGVVLGGANQTSSKMTIIAVFLAITAVVTMTTVGVIVRVWQRVHQLDLEFHRSTDTDHTGDDTGIVNPAYETMDTQL